MSKYKAKQQRKAKQAQDGGVQLKVAGHANPRHYRTTKREARLAIRIKDWEKIDAKHHGAYHKPGSLQ